MKFSELENYKVLGNGNYYAYNKLRGIYIFINIVDYDDEGIYLEVLIGDNLNFLYTLSMSYKDETRKLNIYKTHDLDYNFMVINQWRKDTYKSILVLIGLILNYEYHKVVILDEDNELNA